MLTVRRTQVLRGPSIWAPVPVIVLEVAIGELEARLERETPVFFERLIALVPSLRDAGELVHQPAGGLRRLLLDRLALALQHLVRSRVDSTPWNRAVGADLTAAQTHPTPHRGHYTVVYAYEHSEVGLAAGKLAVRLLNHLLGYQEPDFAFARERAALIALARRHADQQTTAIVVAAAARRGIPVQRLRPHAGRSRDLVHLGTGCYQRRLLWGSITSGTGLIAERIATDKGLTTRLLREAGLPVPRHAVVRSVDEAVTTAPTIGYPVVVKPLDASQGRGLTLDVRDAAEVREVFPRAKQHSRNGQVLVERFLPGRYYRILVVGHEVVAVLEVVPAQVLGDGRHTIAELVELSNADPRRGDPGTLLKRIPVDAQTHTVLAKQGLRQEDVPEAGRCVQVQQFGIYTLGGTYRDRTEEIHPDNIAIARQAAMVVGLDVAGIDLITPDISRSIYDQGGALIEVNQQPGLRVHVQPAEGQPRDVGMAIIDHLFPPDQPVRVPIVAVTGTNGKTTTTRMIAHILTTAGRTVGMTTTDGITIAGIQVATGDSAGASAARRVLRNPAIDYAVLETARGGILRDGLGFASCDVAVVTNVAADHLGREGLETVADLARVKVVVPRAVVPGGASVLNADDPSTVAMAEEAGGEILYFSMCEDSPVIEQHVEQGGRAVGLRQRPAGEVLTLLANGEETAILPVEEIPATLEGRIRVNIANALAATAAAIAQDVPLETIRSALCSFANSFAQTPGRFNFLEVDGRRVLIDYCHNPHGLEGLAEVVQRLQVDRAIAVIRMPGDRREEDIAAFGRLAAQTFDALVIREGKLRGRKPGEVPALLQAAALSGGLASDRIRIILEEWQAVETAIEQAAPGDLVVVMIDGGRVDWMHSLMARGQEVLA